jgi:hypothetical protein
MFEDQIVTIEELGMLTLGKDNPMTAISNSVFHNRP